MLVHSDSEDDRLFNRELPVRHSMSGNMKNGGANINVSSTSSAPNKNDGISSTSTTTVQRSPYYFFAFLDRDHNCVHYRCPTWTRRFLAKLQTLISFIISLCLLFLLLGPALKYNCRAIYRVMKDNDVKPNPFWCGILPILPVEDGTFGEAMKNMGYGIHKDVSNVGRSVSTFLEKIGNYYFFSTSSI